MGKILRETRDNERLTLQWSLNNFSFMPEHFSTATFKQEKKEQPTYMRKQHDVRLTRKKIISVRAYAFTTGTIFTMSQCKNETRK